jgi:hypothetical protein
MDGVRGAFLAGQVGGGCAGDQEHLVFVAHDLIDRECDRGGRHVDDHVDLVDINPRTHDVRPNVRLVLMVGADDLNLHALGGRAKILDRHARRDHRALAAQVGIGARHVVHDADLDGAVGVLRLRPETPEGDRERRETDEPSHWRFSVAKFRILASVQSPRLVMELFGPRAERCYRALALRRRWAIRFKLPCGVSHAAKPDNTDCGFCW